MRFRSADLGVGRCLSLAGPDRQSELWRSRGSLAHCFSCSVQFSRLRRVSHDVGKACRSICLLFLAWEFLLELECGLKLFRRCFRPSLRTRVSARLGSDMSQAHSQDCIPCILQGFLDFAYFLTGHVFCVFYALVWWHGMSRCKKAGGRSSKEV